ncbi:unc-93-like protein a [Plakobranchus ocellatus]|uniref:Unc-93-like protein a n=1 Tax=Plakobranchus ocellatus TaxID=259542 RepID=A0AAV4BBB9_9GAST|nr:unc-93-like protein a [Plakobranchus ocellatus]
MNKVTKSMSSLNSEDHLGLISLSVMYLTVMLGSLLGPVCGRLFGHKSIILGTFVMHLCYTCSNFVPGWSTLLPTSALLGLCAGNMFMSQGVYIAAASRSYIQLKGLPASRLYSAMSLFNGVFYSCFSATQITGNLVSSLILFTAEYNQTLLGDNVCGAQVCADFDGGKDFDKPQEGVIHLLFSCYAACGVLGILVLAVGLPRLSNFSKDMKSEPFLQIVNTHLGGCLSMLFNPKLFILIPSIMAQAILNMLMYTGYTEAFVTCTVGVQWVGYCMVALGVTSSLTALLVSTSARFTGRILQFSVSMGLDIATAVIMLIWVPDYQTSPMVLLILPLIAGLSQGIIQPQQQALLGDVFTREELPSACAAFIGVKCLAFSVYLCLSSTACLYDGLILALGLYAPGVVGYAYTEIRERRRDKDKGEI